MCFACSCCSFFVSLSWYDFCFRSSFIVVCLLFMMHFLVFCNIFSQPASWQGKCIRSPTNIKTVKKHALLEVIWEFIWEPPGITLYFLSFVCDGPPDYEAYFLQHQSCNSPFSNLHPAFVSSTVWYTCCQLLAVQLAGVGNCSLAPRRS